MQTLFLPYETSFDDETRTYCLVGIDSRGQAFGIGSGPTLEDGAEALRDYILEVLETQASQGDDRFGDLLRERPDGDHLALGANELLPIRLKLARTRAKLRQADMAQRLGITQQAYAKLERPGANPRLRTLVQAEQALGTPLLKWL